MLLRRAFPHTSCPGGAAPRLTSQIGWQTCAVRNCVNAGAIVPFGGGGGGLRFLMTVDPGTGLHNPWPFARQNLGHRQSCQ